MNCTERMAYVMTHYLHTNPDPVPEGLRPNFINNLFPKPDSYHSQWDDGDTTSRALDAWLFARRVTGDTQTGLETEEGLWQYFQSFLHPETGLPFVRDHSYPNREGYYYHLWDCGRALTHLVNRYRYKASTPKEKQAIAVMIEKMIAGSLTLSKTTVLPGGKTARYWEIDAFFNDVPVTREMGFGRLSFLRFTVVGAVLLTPVVIWAQLTGKPQHLLLAKELAEGYLAGLERRRESTVPAFGENGAFFGHVHCNLNGLTGLTELGKLLLATGDAQGHRYIDTAIRAYRWMFSPENNNMASSCGWIPENFGTGWSENSELCCTADAIGLAKSLAELAELDPRYRALDCLWDAVDRFTVNELFAAQLLDTGVLRKFFKENTEAYDALVCHIDGAWGNGHTYLHDYTTQMSGVLPEGIIAEKAESAFTFGCGGCCVMSGPRGIHSYWEGMVQDDGSVLNIRFAGSYRSAVAELTDLPNGGFVLKCLQGRQIRVRLPEHCDPATFCLLCNGQPVAFAADGNRRSFQGLPGEEYQICWKDTQWVSTEVLGKPNNGRVPGVAVGERITYHLTYTGNRLTDMQPNALSYIPWLSQRR